MENTQNLAERRLADAIAEVDAVASDGGPLVPDSRRLAFTDPEFLLRRETRGIRFQLEMLKPDLAQQAQGIENTVVVYGSARFVEPQVAQTALAQAREADSAAAVAVAERQLRNSHYYEQARLFARLVAGYGAQRPREERLFICTGGGPGIMEAANRGAHEMGARSVGLNIVLPHEQVGNPYVTPSLSFKFHYFALRKMHFMMRAKALVVFPGGFGTFDELFEVLTLVQTHKTKPVPIVLFGSSFWTRALHLEVLVEQGTLSAEDLELFHVTDDPHEAWEIIRTFYKM